jgi:hypothetical protein
MQCSVRFYHDAKGNKPVIVFLEVLKKKDKILHKLVVAGIKKLGTSETHGPPLTELIDKKYDIFELRVGGKNIARVFFFFQPGQEIIITNGYVKKQQNVDTSELERARKYKADWQERHK